MKKDLVELLRGNTLKNEIYNTISRHKFGSTTRLRHTFNNHPQRYLDFKSEGTEIKTQMGSPAQKTEFSLQKLSKSVNETWRPKRKQPKSTSKSKPSKLQRSQREQTKQSQQKIKSKSQILVSRKNISQQSNYSELDRQISHKASAKTLNLPKNVSKKKKDTAIDNSSFKSKTKMDLESIIEQSSSDQQLITPQHKKSAKKKDKEGSPSDKSPLTNSRTKKKEKEDHFSQSFKRRLEKSFKEPETYQKILKTPYLTISYRIIKKRLIEIQILALRYIETLSVTLEKGNLQCQSIQQQYNHTAANTLLALFSAVRNIDIQRIEDFPKIIVDITVEDDQRMQKNIILPYTWLHFVDEKLPSLKKSKIKTKLCLCDLSIGATNLRVLSEIFPHWVKKTFKGHCEFETGFVYVQSQFSLKLTEQANEKFTLQVEGKGQGRLTKMIEFLQHLIC